MKYLNFDTSRPYDLILLGRVAIDLNPAVSEGMTFKTQFTCK